ncbi:hypothetical protein [Lactobacillus sp.]|uniref:hypothetical protein n=1 Tax=Lactobacillus sp. TaxID=1591 RepID=UPI0019B98D09|nr:hypothetical protein [Lactobacillus sp.]MBD5430679.1 hypothetical protein [Lactobacillus sp.]
MIFKRKKYETYGEGGLYEGVNEATTSPINSNKGCRIHISQKREQKAVIEIINNEKLVKRLSVKGDTWITVKGSGKYWLRVFNNQDKSLKVGLSIRSLD